MRFEWWTIALAAGLLGISELHALSPARASSARASPARASPASPCGVGLSAGSLSCVTWMMTVAEYRALVARANAGDRDAALTLAQFEDFRTDISSTDGGKWWARAAQLGECQALRRLRDDAARIGNASVATHWRARIRHFRCAPEPVGERYMGKVH